MRRAGKVVAAALKEVTAAIEPGVTTRELNAVVEAVIRGAGAIPSFLGVPAIVQGAPDFPAASCISVNEEVVHGLPGDRVLKEGDIVSIDVGAILDGWHGDAAVTVGVGRISPEAERLIRVTREALELGIAQARAGGWLGDISAAIQAHGEQAGFSVVKDFTGHAIGRQMHEGFQIPNFGIPKSGIRLRAGMTMALEPMFTTGSENVGIRSDGWTVATLDGSLSAHFEHSVAVTDTDPIVLTAA
jgi:methionyl aminopeptidase